MNGRFEGENGNRFAAACETRMVEYDSGNPADALAWLADLARRKPELTRRTAFEVIGTIHWLERRKHLASDDHNGVVWTARIGNALVGLRFDLEKSDVRRELFRQLPQAAIVSLPNDVYEQVVSDILHSPKGN
jgi:hypothetical protein